MKGLVRSQGRAPAARQEIFKHNFSFAALALSVAGTTGIGFGTVPIGGLPQGNLLLLGATAYAKFRTADTDVITTFAGNYSIGSAATADLTLSGSEVDVIPSTAISAAVAGVSALVRGANATPVMIDNTDGTLKLNLNLLIADASISGTGDFTADGIVSLVLVVLNDD
jgi:hypothetical protein